MAKDKALYKVVIKDGDYRTEWNSKTNRYDSKTTDYVQEFSDAAAALFAFLEYATDDYNENKISLIYTPAKKK